VLAVLTSDIRIDYGISSHSGSCHDFGNSRRADGGRIGVDHERLQVVGDAQAGRQWDAPR
jgi:hypothetical protein